MSLNIGILESSRSAALSLFLDDYPNAFAAYSFRKLRTAYSGNCIQVRRSSDNTTQNIGFVNNVLDVSTLTTFCGAGDGFISIWYDQSGNTRNQIQNNAASQPQIVSSGTIISVNGKPAYSLNGTNQFLNANISLIATNLSIIQVFKINDNTFMTNYGGSQYALFGWTVNFASDNITVLSRYKNNISLSTTTTLQVSSNYGNNTQILSSAYYGAVNWTFFGFANYTAYYVLGYCQELIFYANNQSSNNSGINNNINSFYTIY
jgi:hypothetical protein